MKYVWVILICFVTFAVNAQEVPEFNEAALRKELASKSEKEAFALLDSFVVKSMHLEPKETIKIMDFYIEFINRNHYNKNRLAKLYLNRGNALRKMGNYPMALKDLKRAEDRYAAKNNISGLQEVYVAYGNLFQRVGDNARAIEYLYKGVELNKKIKSEENNGVLFNSLGNIYKAQHNYDSAFHSYRQAYNVYAKINADYQSALILDNIGMTWLELNQVDSAQYYNEKALGISKKIKNTFLEWQLLANSTGIAEKQKEYGKQLELAKHALDLAVEMDVPAYQIWSKGNYAIALKNNYRTKEALQTFREIMPVVQASGDHYFMQNMYSELSAAFERENQPDSALYYYKLSTVSGDSLEKINAQDKVNEIIGRFQLSETKKDLESLKLIASAYQERDELKTLVIWIASGLIALVLILAVIILIRYRDKQKLNKVLKEKNVEIIQKNAALANKNDEITDSINYAQRIQATFLPSEADFTRSFTDSFVLFKPKDIVSGDFYWFTEKNNYIIYVTADCTGHGVPGGFMSMLGTSLLNQVIIENGITEPAEILNILREKVIQGLKQTGATGESKDGMDMVLTRYDMQKMELTYAAANNNFYLVRNGELMDFSPDKQPIGYFSDDVKSFTQHTIKIQKGDCIYTFTDGYPDQFGLSPEDWARCDNIIANPASLESDIKAAKLLMMRGKKFKYKKLEEILVSHYQKPMSEQKKNLDNALHNWKGSLDQNDDICVVGVRV